MHPKSKFLRSSILAAATIMAGAVHQTAGATPVFFFDEIAFTTAAATAGISLATESFESGVTDFGNTITFPGGSISTTGTGPNINTLGGGNSTDGTTSISWFPASLDVMTIGLSTPTNAFGIDIIDGFEASPFELTLSASGGAVTLSPGQQPDLNVRFIGVIDTMQTFATATITTSPSDFHLFDRLQTGIVQTDIPEPATLALFGLGLAGLVFSRRGKSNRGGGGGPGPGMTR